MCWSSSCSQLAWAKLFKSFFSMQLLRDGLNDLSEVVVKGCVHGLLRSWSLECDDGNFISLLARLDVESFPEVRLLQEGGEWRRDEGGG